VHSKVAAIALTEDRALDVRRLFLGILAAPRKVV